jgi:hypothetical protein
VSDALPQLIATHPLWTWFAIGAAFLAVEVVTGSGWLLWPAGSAAIVALVSVFAPMSGAAATALFAVCTLVTTYIGRRYLVRTRPVGPDVNAPAARMVGHRGRAAGAFEGGRGRVFVDGKEWSAELDGAGALTSGAEIEVVAVVGGARLKVAPLP